MRLAKALACAMVMGLLAGCQVPSLPVIAPAPSPTPAYSESERAEMGSAIARFRILYDQTMERLEQRPLAEAMAQGGALQEYRVLQHQAKAGYDYYWFGVYADGMGRFVCMALDPAMVTEGIPDKVVVKLDTKLSVGETQALLDVIDKNNFFDIPPKHPDEQNGLDGKTIYIEGSDGERMQFAKMWSAPSSYPIAQILVAMQEFEKAHLVMEGS